MLSKRFLKISRDPISINSRYLVDGLGATANDSPLFLLGLLGNMCCIIFFFLYCSMKLHCTLPISLFFISNFSIAIVGNYVSGRPTSHSSYVRMTGKSFHAVDGNIASCFTIKRQNVCNLRSIINILTICSIHCT